MAINWTSGQLASWKAGRGFFPGTLVGGIADGGVAVGGGPGRRTTMTMMAATNPTTRATAPAAISARMRCRRRRSADLGRLPLARDWLRLFGEGL
jgi:hypothetical protein